MLELIVYPKANEKKLINNSPFCSKAEILLRLAKVEHKITEFNDNPGKFPKGKLPVLKEGDILIEDSNLIEDYIEKKYSFNLDEHLDETQKATGFAFTRLAENYLYWAILYERWMIDKNWEKLKNSYFAHIPKFIRGMVTNMIRKSTAKSLHGHGMGRFSEEEILLFGEKAIKSIADYLEDKDYFLSNQLSSYDITIYAFISSVIYSDLGPRLKEYASEFPQLSRYCDRMYRRVF